MPWTVGHQPGHYARMNRRDFGKGLAVAGVATAVSRARIAGANERINVGLIGHGNKGQALWRNFRLEPDVNPVAVADVYQPFLDQGVAAAPGAKAHHDFRKLLDDKDVDAVIVATPDHWHALMMVMACRAGKDVYVEKPLALTVREGRTMVTEARKHKRVVQVGSQQRSGAHYAKAVALVQQGAIGEVHEITVGFTRNVLPGFKPKDLPVVEGGNLDWDLWLGPAPKVAFDPFRCLYNFRWFWDYSGGQMTNFGAHHLDIARWALGAKAPATIAGLGGRFAVKDGGQTPDVQEVLYQFPGCVVTWTGREVNRGERSWDIELHGTKGTIGLSRSGWKLTPEGKTESDDAAKKPVAGIVEEKSVPFDRPHIRNFLDCVKSRAVPAADVEEGHRTATMCHLGNIATRLGRSLRWDGDKEQVVADAEANRWLARPYRKPWSLG
jgi:predicted dehydrogenase